MVASAHAGTYTFHSVSVNVPLGGWQTGTNCTTSNATKTATITLAGSLTSSGPSDNKSLFRSIAPPLTFKVKWTPSYVGEPYPSSVQGYLKRKHKRQSGYSLASVTLGNPGYMREYTDVSILDGNVFNAGGSDVRSGTGPASITGVTSLNAYSLGTSPNWEVETEVILLFNFAWDNGEWIGSAEITPPISANLVTETQWSGYFSNVPTATCNVDINIRYTWDRMI